MAKISAFDLRRCSVWLTYSFCEYARLTLLTHKPKSCVFSHKSCLGNGLFLPFCLVVILIFTGCSKYSGADSEIVKPAQSIEGFFIAETQNAKESWELRAKDGHISEDGKSVELSKPSAVFYENGKPSSDMKADSGSFFADDKIIVMRGNITAKSFKDGAELKTNKLSYSFPRKEFYTKNEVNFVRGGVKIKGRGLTANSDLSEIKIKNQKAEIVK